MATIEATRILEPMHNADATRVLDSGEAAAAFPSLALVALEGQVKGSHYPIGMGQCSYGRSSHNDLVITDPTISKHHGTIDYRGNGEVIVCDQGSTNGIKSEGRWVRQVSLRLHQQIQIGGVRFQLLAFTPLPHAAALPLVSRDDKSPRSWRISPQWISVGLMLAVLAILAREPAPVHKIVESTPQAQVLSTVVSNGSSHHAAPPRSRRATTATNQTTPKPTSKAGMGEARLFAEQAQGAFAGGQYEQAYALWTKVLTLAPTHALAMQGLTELEHVAERLLESASMLRWSDPLEARRLLKRVTAMTAVNSSVHAQAQALLEKGGAA